ncbi:aminopeptidase PepB [Enterovibrio norvegicus FF-33]|uniref:Aminopeptidase PepB n=1 Tax=Enterovibrio norvegicus FF-454 TaxID=1185651 RepID=A0A1E5C2X1_9GAMM|nr:aminopeptidase PepB [Enterovibrio norvegicus]OEE59859.1 aminopeptidase PepB [Enterovibrio norvegicus FF-454]OEE69860.1 aminopeptidase PepB [Enterovibrio norvegicus FF-33]OEE87985.1 aminopeptidase PepB [Enterovibrio norvegicus FF-162]
MTDKMRIALSHESAADVWGANAVVSFGQDGATVHATGEDTLSPVQQAARKLESQGIRKVSLMGDNWDLETAWAFYQGLRGPKSGFEFEPPALEQKSLKALNDRITAIDWVCQVINETAEEVGPQQLAVRAGEFIKSQAPSPENVSYKIVSGADLLEHGWVGVHTVGRGSARKPAMLQLDYNPTGDENAEVFACIIGKGITFDSGGYSIKQSSFMDAMKADMGGAAMATGGLGLAIAQGLNKRVKLILCCAENMISSNAYKLGDIITYKNGVTVEVLNSDAEGRLVLADGLLYANQFKPALTIDCATLTGSAKMALGNDYHALFSFDQSLAQRCLSAADAENEGMWQLPVADFHRNMLPSSFADLANVGAGQYSPGASTAAAFLSYFVDDYKNGWIHLDCSGTYRKGASDKWAVGATGMGVKSLSRILMDESSR